MSTSAAQTLPPPSPEEVVMELVRGIRARDLTSVDQVRTLSRELFPEFTDAEHAAGIQALANCLCANLTPIEKRQFGRRRSAAAPG